MFHKESTYKLHVENPDSCVLDASKKAAFNARKVRTTCQDILFHLKAT